MQDVLLDLFFMVNSSRTAVRRLDISSVQPLALGPPAMLLSTDPNPQTTHTPASSDTSDPSVPNENTHLRTSYLAMKEGMLIKTSHAPSYLSLSSAQNSDSQRRVRFEQIYMTASDDYDRPPSNSTIVWSTVSTVG